MVARRKGGEFTGEIAQDLSHQGVLQFKKPHVHQQKILDFPGNTVTMAGRRFGKSDMAIIKIYTGALQEVGLYWWTCLSWKSAAGKRAWRLLKFWAIHVWRAVLRTRDVDEKKFIRETRFEIDLPNGSQIWMRSAENPDSFVGEGVRGVIMDEFTFMEEEIWEAKIRQTLYDYQGWVMMIGVPNGEGWHSKIWRQAAERPGWAQFHFTSYDNPTIPHLREILDEEKLTMPSIQWEQEVMANIVDGAHTVFKGVRNCIDPDIILPGLPEKDHYYVFGVDFARVVDYTVVAVWDLEQRALVHYDRFNILSYPRQVKRIVRMSEVWNPITIVCDAVGLGAPIIQLLREEGLPVREFVTTQNSKADLITQLALDIQYKNIVLPDDKIMLDEFLMFRVELTPEGREKYGAPEGYHDDVVMAVAYGYSQVSTQGLQIF